MRHVDLFSGIGGFTIAAQWAGFETIAFSEIDKYSCKILKQHWPDIKNYGDIKNINGSELGTVELVTGGFPCQPFSVAGQQRGKEDDRYLWPEMLRVISECKPAWVLGENVTGIIDMELDDIISDLERVDYECQPIIIPARAVGSGHQRKRVWIIAHSKCERRQRCIQNTKLSRRPVAAHPEFSHGIIQSWDELGKCRGSLRAGDGLRPGMVRNQVKGLGNAIVPQVAYEILKIMYALSLAIQTKTTGQI